VGQVGQRICQTKAHDVIDVLVCEMEWNRALLTMALITGAAVFMPAFKPQKDILNIHCDTN